MHNTILFSFAACITKKRDVILNYNMSFLFFFIPQYLYILHLVSKLWNSTKPEKHSVTKDHREGSLIKIF